MTTDNLVLMATMGKAHGLRGECYLYSYAAPPEAIFSFPLLQTADGKKITIEKWRAVTGGFLVKCAGVGDRTAASHLSQQGIFVERAALPPPPPNHHYQHDLIGYVVEQVGREGEAQEGEKESVIGQVAGFANYGAGDIVVIKNKKGEEFFVPFQNAAIIKIITSEKKIIVASNFLL